MLFYPKNFPKVLAKKKKIRTANTGDTEGKRKKAKEYDG